MPRFIAKYQKIVRENPGLIRVILVTWLFLLSIHWMAIGLAGGHGFFGWMPVLGHFPLLLLLLDLGLLAWSSLWLYTHRHRFLPVRSLSRASAEPCSCIVATVSTPRPIPHFADGGRFPLTVEGPSGNGEPLKVTLEGRSLSADVDALDKIRWNWQQLLRAFVKHPQLRRVYLLGSKDPGGSYRWLETCRSLLQAYFPDAEIVIADKAVDFEDLNELYNVVNRIVVEEKQRAGSGAGSPATDFEKELVIDVTGGQKTASIAAALVTLHNRVRFQYVQTNPPFEVYTYDVIGENYVTVSE